MPEEKDNTPRLLFLVSSLVLTIIFIVGLAAIIFTYNRFLAPKPLPTPESTHTLRPTNTSTETPLPTLTPTITHTPRATPSLTASLTAASLPTLPATLTPTGLPTLTPAHPLPKSLSYSLQGWSADQADYTVQLLEGYPDTLPVAARGKGDAAYYAAFVYPALAEKEALLRFPNAPQADHWRWQLAYDLARSGDIQSGKEYADLIAASLNRGETELPSLYTWLQAKEPRLALYMVQLKPVEGYIGSYLVELRGSGSAFIWILQTTGAYQAYPLYTRFDYANAPKANWILSSLSANPENAQDVAIYFSNAPGQLELAPPRVFNLDQVPPKILPFLPDHEIFNVGEEFTNYWEIDPSAAGGNELVFKSTVFPACPVTVRRAYLWNGEYFAFDGAQYQVESSTAALAYCGLLVDHAADLWGPEAAIPIMETLSPSWPPAKDAQAKAYPPDAADEWLYRLGVYNALTGKSDAARGYFNQVISEPSVRNSQWIAPSQAFLQAYRQASDIYRACYGAPFCDSQAAILYLVDHMPAGADGLIYLQQQGVATTASGYFDFDKDQEAERWFTVRKRAGEKLQLWILARYGGQVKALPVAYVEASAPSMDYLDPAYIAPAGIDLQPAVFLNGQVAISLRRKPETREPYIASVPLRSVYPSPFFDRLDVAEAALYAGVMPQTIHDQLVNMKTYPGLLCAPTWSCDGYYYMLGLASELSGDELTAVDAYHQLWLDYTKSPFTTLARLKLAGGVYVSPTPTSIATPTSSLATLPAQPTATLIPTVTGTPPTPTPTVTGTPPTPTPTVTPTVTGTPPTATPTVTGTPPTVTPSPTRTATSLPGGNPTATETTIPYPYPYPYP